MGQYISPDALDHVTKCAIIFYPGDDGGLFLAALKGQLTQLESAWIWEGEREYTEAITQIWAEHNILSEEAWYKVDCEAVPILTGDEDMNVNVTMAGCGCGCGCGNSGSENNPFNPSSPIVPPGTPDTPTVTQDVEHSMSQGELCDMANYLADGYVSVFVTLNSDWDVIGTSALAVVEAIQLKLAQYLGASLVAWAGTLIATLTTLLTYSAVATLVDKAKSSAESVRNQLVCAIVNSSSPVQAEYNFESVLASTKQVYGTSQYILLWIVAQLWDWDKVLTPGEVTVPAQYIGSVCECGQVPEDPEDPEAPSLPLPITIYDCAIAGEWARGDSDDASLPIEASFLIDGGVACPGATAILNPAGKDALFVGGSSGGSVGFPFVAPSDGQITLSVYVGSNFAQGLVFEVRAASGGAVLATQTVASQGKNVWGSVTFDYLFLNGQSYFVTWHRGGTNYWYLADGSFG